MAKKSMSTMTLVELIGFVLATIGFFCPMAKGKLFGSNGGSGLNFIKNLFDSKTGSTFQEIMALLILVCAVLGILVILAKLDSIIGLVAAIGGIACGVLFYLKSIGVFDSGITKGAIKVANKIGGAVAKPGIGIYLLCIGFVVALVGALLSKKK